MSGRHNLNWQPYLNGRIQELREYDWFKSLTHGLCTKRYRYVIRNNDNGSKVTCGHEFSQKLIMPKIRRYVSYRPLIMLLTEIIKF